MYILSEKENKKIALVDLLTEQNKLFWDITQKTILKYKKEWKKILFITNRKWYTSSSLCLDCGNIPKCKNCDIPIAKYVVKDKNNFIHMCPICKTHYENFWTCTKCHGTNIKEYGIGTYKLKEYIKEFFNIDCKVIENTDVNSLNKIQKLNLKNEQFIISTSILACETNNFKPDIVIFPNADIWLSLPDFNVAEKHFLFLYEFIKKYSTSNFIIQTFNRDHYVYKHILKLDLNGFWEQELEFRKMFSYPPYSELAVLMYKSEIEDRVYRKISKLESELKYLIEKENTNIEIFPTPQLVYKKFWKYHYNIVLKWNNLKSFLDKAVILLKIKEKWFQIDWLPVNVI